MNILAVVPARGGSKRLPGKNIRMLGDRPLIAWTIRAAHDSGCCSSILASTDDPAIAKVAQEHGAVVPWLRPAELAGDAVPSVDVVLHALEWHEREAGPVDGVLLLQPTSPFRSAGTIRRAVDAYKEEQGRRPVVSVGPAASHPAWCFRIGSGRLEPFLDGPMPTRSQDLEPAWTLNGALYLVPPHRLRLERKLVTPDARPLAMEDPLENMDIDTLADFQQCEYSLRMLRGADGKLDDRCRDS